MLHRISLRSTVLHRHGAASLPLLLLLPPRSRPSIFPLRYSAHPFSCRGGIAEEIALPSSLCMVSLTSSPRTTSTASPIPAAPTTTTTSSSSFSWRVPHSSKASSITAAPTISFPTRSRQAYTFFPGVLPSFVSLPIRRCFPFSSSSSSLSAFFCSPFSVFAAPMALHCRCYQSSSISYDSKGSRPPEAALGRGEKDGAKPVTPSKESGSPSPVAHPARPLLADTQASDARKPSPLHPKKVPSSTGVSLSPVGTTAVESRPVSPMTASGQEKRTGGGRPSPLRPSTTTTGSTTAASPSTPRRPSPTPFDAKDVDVSRLTHEFWAPVTDALHTPEGGQGGAGGSSVSLPSSPYASADVHRRKTVKEEKGNESEEKNKRQTMERIPMKARQEGSSTLTEQERSRVLGAAQEVEHQERKGPTFTEALEAWPPSMVEEFLYPIEFMGQESLLFIAPEDRKFLRQEFA